jgi:uncharacterized RDD family membrane protein YckC
LSQPWTGSQVVIGEAVALDLRPAAIPSRIVAGALDVLLQLVIALPLGFLVAVASTGTSQAGAAALVILLLVVVLIAYPVTFETLLRGRTPGKAVMGLRVVRDDGGPVGFRHALVRGLAGAFLERPGITVFVGGVVTSLLHPQSKRLGDLLAGTIVLQERVPSKGGGVARMPPKLAGWAAGLDLSALPDDLALQVRQFISRQWQLTPEAREELGGRLAAAVTAAVHPPPPPGTPGWAVLAAVLAERRRREELRLRGARPPAPQSPASHAPAPHAPAPAPPATAQPGQAPDGPGPSPTGFAPPG